jgi:hypothetical protein
MATKLNNTDYINILNFYNITIPKSKKQIKQKAENIMAEKLCKCIKKIDTKAEAKSIGICTRTIFNSKGYTRGLFQCKNKRTVKFRKTKKCPLEKELNTRTKRCVNKCKPGFVRNKLFKCKKPIENN